LKEQINLFLEDKLKISLHPNKSRIVSIFRGVDFIGFRIFPKYRLLRKRNVQNMHQKSRAYEQGKLSFKEIFQIYQGWQAYAKWADTFRLKEKIKFFLINFLLKNT